MSERRPLTFAVEVERDLKACFPRLRFHGHHLDDLVHWLGQYEREPWTRETVLAARRNPVFIKYFGTEWLQSYFGRGRKTRRGWAVMACMIAGLTLEAVRAAQHKPERGFGSATGPLITFVHRRLARIVSDKTPKPESILDMLKAAMAAAPL